MKLVLIVAIYSIFSTAAVAGLFLVEPMLLLTAVAILNLFLLLQTYLAWRAADQAGKDHAFHLKEAEGDAAESRSKAERLEQKESAKEKEIITVSSERDELRERYNEALLKAQEERENNENLKRRTAELEQRLAAGVKAQQEKGISTQQSAIVNLLAEMQEKGRLLDFLMDDVTPYPDAQVGAAARVVHQGAARVLKERLHITPVHSGREGEPKTLEANYDVRAWRLVGRVSGNPPFAGQVIHCGWKIERFNLPQSTSETNVIVPAELEVR